MKAGRASQTSMLVAQGRAAADGRIAVGRFSDPIAIQLLPAKARLRVEMLRSGRRPPGLRGRMFFGYLTHQANMMAVRTTAIDDAVRAAHAPQLVILGAGLDSRAYRMSELKDVTVFEVDHPDTQADKRERVKGLTPLAHDLRYVAVDFTKESFAEKLAAAGHDASKPTMWIWEGVVMYLTRPQVDASLEMMARLCAPGSRLAVMYHAPALMLFLVGSVTRLVGEPLRSRYQPAEMGEALRRHGFEVLRDADIPELTAEIAPEIAGQSRAKHSRIAVAERRG